jgi:hypothetical protein
MQRAKSLCGVCSFMTGVHVMAIALPPPKVPGLGTDNSIDLEELGSDDLETYISYPGLKEGDQFWPNWRGCDPTGQVIDYFNDLVEVGPGDVTPQGMPVYIANHQLKALDQGWVFYSYQMDDPNAPDGRGEESLRIFFYVGKRSVSLALPVPQLKESHDLHVDVSLIGPGGATVVTLPYLAMSVGDKVTLEILFSLPDIGIELPFKQTKELVEANLGKPLEWVVPETDFLLFEDGYATLEFSVVYANPTVPTRSQKQVIRILPPTTPLLPALIIKEAVGDMLDPDAYPDGVTLVIPVYRGIQVGDDIVLYANGDTRVVKTLRVDQSTVDSEVLLMTLGYDWLSANNGNNVSLSYQYARVGSAGTSESLNLTLRKPLYLPPPIVEGVVRDGEDEEYRGYLLARNTTNGAYCKLPVDAAIGQGDKVQMVWEGHVNGGGRYIADPTVGDQNRFQIPKQYIPANLGKRLPVYYQVTLPGETNPYKSMGFNLEIRDMDSGWPTIQIKSPPAPGNKVSLATVSTVVNFELASWTFMAEGQRVRVIAKGVLQAGGDTSFNLREGDEQEVVTEDEYRAGILSANLPRDFLVSLKLNEQFDVIVETSFDGGETYKAFPRISPQLVA